MTENDCLNPRDLLVQRNGVVWGRRTRTRFGRVLDATGQWRASCIDGWTGDIERTRHDAIGSLLDHLNSPQDTVRISSVSGSEG